MTKNTELEVLDIAAQLVDAFSRHEPEKYFSFFADDATFVFYTHPATLTSRNEWEALWVEWENTLGFRVRSCVSHEPAVQPMGENAAVFRHTVESHIEMSGTVDTVWERETIVFHRVDSTWLAIHEHLSPWESAA